MKRLLLVLALAVLLLGVPVVSACSPSKAEVAAQQKQECASNQHRIKLATDLVNADTGIYPDIASVVDKLHAVCPNGGVYSFDPATDTVSCSVHGKL